MKRSFFTFCGFLVLFALACKSVPQGGPDQTTRLYGMMTGSFSSAEQAAADTNFYDISLHMYPIWQKQYPGEYWLYVEQALGSQQDKPYRQRVYHVEKLSDNEWQSVVYTLPNPEKFVLKWKTPEVFDQLKKEDLVVREGCAVFLSLQKNGSFSGKTREGECGSTLRGASFAASEVTVWADKISSWDQGFNEAGEQVWGATTGGYVFKRL
ncbi:MAG: chromophore lyase CpcT/CpeT [Bacteroidia bacterium]